MTKKKKNPPKYALLIWACLPESVEAYLIPFIELDKRQRVWLRRCHGNYVNSGQHDLSGGYSVEQVDEALSMVNEMLGDPGAEWLKKDASYFTRQAEAYKMDEEGLRKLYGSWHSYKMPLGKPKTIPRARVVHSGFII